MKTLTVRGLVVSDRNGFWEVLIDLQLNETDNIADQELTFGAALPPPDGNYTLMFFYKGQRHEQKGRIRRHLH